MKNYYLIIYPEPWFLATLVDENGIAQHNNELIGLNAKGVEEFLTDYSNVLEENNLNLIGVVTIKGSFLNEIKSFVGSVDIDLFYASEDHVQFKEFMEATAKYFPGVIVH